jgi:hypothetical protein
MMTLEMITTKLDTIVKDSWYEVDGNEITLTINDFEGFDDDWCEVDREFADEDAVEEVLVWLERNADRVEGDLYQSYFFGDIEVCVGATSFDI